MVDSELSHNRGFIRRLVKKVGKSLCPCMFSLLQKCFKIGAHLCVCQIALLHINWLSFIMSCCSYEVRRCRGRHGKSQISTEDWNDRWTEASYVRGCVVQTNFSHISPLLRSSARQRPGLHLSISHSREDKTEAETYVCACKN